MSQEREDMQRSVQQLTEKYKNAQMDLVKANLQVPVVTFDFHPWKCFCSLTLTVPAARYN
jgi:hypothetical protein